MILCMMAIRDRQISSLYRIPCTQTTNQKQDKPHSFQESLKNVEEPNFGRERVGMELIQNVVYILQILNQSRLNWISFCCEKNSFNRLLIGDCICFVLACVSFH